MDGSIWVGIGQKVEPASRSCRRWRSRRTPLAFSPGTLCHESFPTIRNSTPIDLLAMNRSAAGRFLERDAKRPRDAINPDPANNLAFLGGGRAAMASGEAPQSIQDVEPVAAGDLMCTSCKGGRPSGMTGAYRVEGDILCHKCAVKRLGIENEPSSEIPGILRPFSLQRK